MSLHKIILIFLSAIFFISFSIGSIHVAGGDFSGISYLFAPFGIFIWGDAIILGLLLFISCVWLLIKNSPTWTGLFFSSYALIRSLFEVVYDLNAQFSLGERPWESNWSSNSLVTAIGRTEVFVISQLIFTMVAIVSLLFLVYFTKLYLKER